MIDAHAVVARCFKIPPRKPCLSDPCPGVGKRLVPDQPLVRLHPGYMGVTEHRIAGRKEADRLFDGARDRSFSLEGKAEHQVEVNVGNPCLPDCQSRIFHHRTALNPTDRFLNGRVKRLDAEARAVHSKPRKMPRAL